MSTKLCIIFHSLNFFVIFHVILHHSINFVFLTFSIVPNFHLDSISFLEMLPGRSKKKKKQKVCVRVVGDRGARLKGGSEKIAGG